MPGPNGENHIAENVESQPVDSGHLEVQPVKPILKVGKANGDVNDRGQDKFRRNISWQDFHGRELAQVHEYEPRLVPCIFSAVNW